MRAQLGVGVHPFDRRFCSSSSFMRATIDTSMPPNLERHLYNVAELIACVRQSSGTAAPASASFRTAMIWLSVNRDVFMRNLLEKPYEKLPLLTTLFRGDCHCDEQWANRLSQTIHPTVCMDRDGAPDSQCVRKCQRDLGDTTLD